MVVGQAFWPDSPKKGTFHVRGDSLERLSYDLKTPSKFDFCHPYGWFAGSAEA
jgi:hypothetical protein